MLQATTACTHSYLQAEDAVPYLQGLQEVVPWERMAYILTQTGRASKRNRRLPAPAVSWLVIAMSLWSKLSIPQVWRRLHPTLEEPEPSESALAQARKRLGVAPLRQLFLQIARPMATHQTPGAFYRGWRLMALDGTVLDLPDSDANARVFGRPETSRAPGAYPQAQLLALCELGTHAVCGLAIKPIHCSEVGMVPSLLELLEPGMLLIWDRGFFSYELIQAVCKRGAHLLARVKSNTVLRPLQRLADGSFLAKIYPCPRDRDQDRQGFLVRVNEYTHNDPHRPGAGERHRLITDILNPNDLPAQEAPLVYHERWEEELTFDEIKTHLNGRRVPIRSQTPAGVVQEIYGLMLAHYIIRRVMHDAAVVGQLDPDRLSFTNSWRILQCQLPESPQLAPTVWYRRLLREVRRQVMRPRRQRWYPRVIKKKMSNWKKKRPEHRHPPQPTKPFREAVVILI
jgi:Insertion element 4 transposase N-terminal/Transposase DDE domain